MENCKYKFIGTNKICDRPIYKDSFCQQCYTRFEFYDNLKRLQQLLNIENNADYCLGCYRRRPVYHNHCLDCLGEL